MDNNNKPKFYEKLSEQGKKVFDNNNRALTERFINLMNQEKPSKDATAELFYNTEERDYLGKENLVLLGDLHEADAEYYMLDN